MDQSTLAILRQQLQEALNAVEQRQQEIDTHLRPKTLADVELLEQKIAASLEDLQALKAEMVAKERQTDKEKK